MMIKMVLFKPSSMLLFPLSSVKARHSSPEVDKKHLKKGLFYF